MSKRLHPDVEFAVNDAAGDERIFGTFADAASFAVAIAASSGRSVNLDVLIWSEEGADAYGGSDDVEQYLDDPDASVFERLVVTVDAVGRVP